MLGEVVGGHDRRAGPVAAVGQDRGLARVEQAARAPAELGAFLAPPDHPLDPVQERLRVAALPCDVDVARVLGEWPERLVGRREAVVALRSPLHRGAHAHAAFEVQVLGHPDLLAVEEDGRARQRERDAVGETDAVRVAAEHRRQPATQAAPVELVVLLGAERREDLGTLRLAELVQGELVVVAHEVGPLRVLGDRRERAQGVGDRCRPLAREREEQGLVDREAQDHVQLVAVLVAEELALLLGVEIDLTHEDRLARAPRQEAAQVAQELVRVLQRALRQAHRLEHEGHRIDAESGEPLVEPETDDLGDLVADLRVRDVQIGLEGVEAVQVVLARLVVPRPVRALVVGEHDVPRLLLGLLVHPDVEVAVRRVAVGACGLEPRMLVGRVVHHEVGDHADAPVARRAQHLGEVAVGAELGMDAVEVADVVAVVATGGGMERHEPQARDADAGEVVEPVGQALQVAATVAVGVEEALHRQAVEDRVLPPDVAGRLAPHPASPGRTCSENASMNGPCSRPDVVDVELVGLELEQLVQPGGELPEIAGHEDRAAHVLGSDVTRRLVERLDAVEVPRDRRAEDVRAPLVVGDRERLVVGGRPADVHLDDEPALASGVAPAADDALHGLARLEDRRQAVRPAGQPAGGRLAHRCADERRRLGGERPQPGAVDVHEPVVRDLLAREQRAHDVDALAQPGVARRLVRPALARDVLVGGLAAAERDPQPPREHLADRRRRLRDDRRVVALAGRVHDAERQRGRRHRGGEPRPGEARLALAHAPGREVVGGHATPEPGGLRRAGDLEQHAGRDLLVRVVQADDRHVGRAVPARPAEHAA